MNTNRGTPSALEPSALEQQSTAVPLLGIGDVVGRYRLVGLIGEGRSGPLYVAEQSPAEHGAAEHGAAEHGVLEPPRTVALRCIHAELTQGPGFRERFSEAARVAARCEHPNVVQVLEMAEVRGRHFVSMELLPGESLPTILARCRDRAELTPDIAAHLVKRVASAVQHARAVGEALSPPVAESNLGVDPSNVVVTHTGVVKWLGIASLAPSGTPAASAGSDGDGDGWDAYELGALLWTCLSGARSEIPDALAAIAMQAISADARGRFQSVQALSEALDRYFFGRDFRPTTDHLRGWMARLFGPEDAATERADGVGVGAPRGARFFVDDSEVPADGQTKGRV